MAKMIAGKLKPESKKLKSDSLIPKLVLIISVFSFLLYANTIPNGYNLDDELVTIHHRLTSKGISAIPEIFSSPYYKDAAGNEYEYRPVTLTTFAIEHQLFGDNAHVSHLVNALIYVLLSVLLFLTLLKLFNTYNYLLPLTITLLFVAHPLHTEAVAGIKSRDELLCFLGGILSFYYSLFYYEKGKVKDYILFVFFFVFALLSKKSIFPFALLIPISNIVFSKGNILRLVLISLPLSIVSGLFWPFDNVFEKIGFGLILFAIPQIIYFLLFNTNGFIESVKSLFQTITKVPGILMKRSNTTPLITSAKFQCLLFAITFLVSFLMCYYDLKLLLILYLIFLILIYRVSSTEIGNRIFYSVILLLCIAVHFYLLSDLLPLIFAIGLSAYFSEGKKFKDLLPLAIILVIPVFEPTSDLMGIYIFLLFVSFIFLMFFETKRKIIWAGFYVIITAVRLFISSEINLAFYVSLGISAGLIYLYLRQEYIKKNATYFFIISAIPVLMVYFASHWGQMPQTKAIIDAQVKVVALTEKAQQVKIIPASGRELNFIETPVTNSDPLSIRVGTSFTVLGKYLQLLVFPYNMGFYYGYAQIEPVPWNKTKSVISIFFYLLLGLSTIYFFRNHSVYSYGIIFYLLCISTFSNLAAPVAGMMADRLSFVASAGFCIAIGYLLLNLSKIDIKSKNVRLNFGSNKILIISLVLVLYSVKTISRNLQWKDSITLMSHDIKYLEKSVQANNLLAVNLVEKSFKVNKQQEKDRYLNQAITHFKKAVEIYPKADFAWHDLGQTYALLNDNNKALSAFLKAIEIDSTYVTAWIKAGAIFSKKQNYPEAVRCFEKVLSLDSSNIQVYTSLSEAYFFQKKFEKAIQINLLAIKKMPNIYDPLVNIGKTYFTMGDKKNALLYFEKAYKINAFDKNLVLTMATIYKDLGEAEKAELYFSKSKGLKN